MLFLCKKGRLFPTFFSPLILLFFREKCPNNNSWHFITCAHFYSFYFSNFFFTSSSSQSTSSEKHLQESPSSSSDSNQSDLYSKPIKMRKLDQSKAQMIYHNNRPHSPPSPGCYPSPPESLSPNDQLTQHNQQQNPINLKGGSYCITPLMVFIMGRSKLQHSQAQKNPNFTDHLNDADVVETFVSSGADLNSQNLDEVLKSVTSQVEFFCRNPKKWGN